ncbi:uncharacterized protein L203_103175 [Cryptococcus depauperatus CBS 7841]|uniref:Uncharacterized protein n=1 Tax=Cryptococcus depauperatus CBS 7841 TaxID=1295531 RepID=A0A1E3IPA8_9TREE|nr:hypothetical protein L203_01548 [Cryptococcus depauperatus CBS 7841]
MADKIIDFSAAKSVWRLIPLPLARLNPAATQSQYPRGRRIPTLRSFCLATLSRSFHLTEPSTFHGVHSDLMRRVLLRVRADRGYENKQGIGRLSLNPDEATIWAFDALHRGVEAGSFTLALPLASILWHLGFKSRMPALQHPLNELPALFKSSPFSQTTSLLTSLTLNGGTELIDDQNIQTLKYCTHLTVLRMNDCSITDDGIRLLRSALELPGLGNPSEGKGMWRLNAWYLRGCKGVSDKSAKVLARWPGLVAIDVRGTSCTEVFIDVINRTSRNIFFGQNTEFEPCTDGLVSLFDTCCSYSAKLDGLYASLTKLSGQSSNIISLNVVSSTIPISNCDFPQNSTITSTTQPNLSCCLDNYSQAYNTDATHLWQTMEQTHRPFDSSSLPPSMTESPSKKGSHQDSDQIHVSSQSTVQDKKKECAFQKSINYNNGEGQAQFSYITPLKSLRSAANHSSTSEQGIESDHYLMLVRQAHSKWHRLAYATSVPQTFLQPEKDNWAKEAKMRIKKGKAMRDILEATDRMLSMKTCSMSANETNPDGDVGIPKGKQIDFHKTPYSVSRSKKMINTTVSHHYSPTTSQVSFSRPMQTAPRTNPFKITSGRDSVDESISRKLSGSAYSLPLPRKSSLNARNLKQVHNTSQRTSTKKASVRPCLLKPSFSPSESSSFEGEPFLALLKSSSTINPSASCSASAISDWDRGDRSSFETKKRGFEDSGNNKLKMRDP